MNSTEQELKAAQQAIRNAHIKAATADFQFNPAYNKEDRYLILNHRLEKQLEQAGGELLVRNGELMLVRKDNPDLELFNEKQEKVSIQSILDASLQGLGTASTLTAPTISTEKTTDPLTGETSWTEANGDKHVIIGNHEYVFPSYKPNPFAGMSMQEVAKENLRQLGVNP